MPPLPVVTEKAIWIPTWPKSHHEDVDSSGHAVIDVLFLPEFRSFRGGAIKMNPSHQTTHVKVNAGSYMRRSRAGKALIDTGSPHSFVWCSFFESMLCLRRVLRRHQ